MFFILALFQLLTPGSREFEDVLNILHSSYLEPTSATNFNYKRACLIHNELLEKEVCFKLWFLWDSSEPVNLEFVLISLFSLKILNFLGKLSYRRENKF